MDFVGLYSFQRNQARLNFGQTSVHLPGRNDVNYPALTGFAAKSLIVYWRGEAARVLDFLNGDVSSSWTRFLPGVGLAWSLLKSPPDTAHIDKWKRDIKALLEGGATDTIVSEANRAGENKLPEDMTVRLWDILDRVVIPMGALSGTPSRWELFKQSLPPIPGLDNPWLVGALVVGAVLLLKD
jgi:hypothetical protein